MSNRVYTVSFSNIPVSSAQDLIALYTGAAVKCRPLMIEMAANGQTTIDNYPFQLIRLAATVTPGSGGNAAAIIPVDPLDRASLSTARINDTTEASSSTSNPILSSQFDPINGYVWQMPTSGLIELPLAQYSDAFILRLLVNPVGTIDVSTTLWFEEF